LARVGCRPSGSRWAARSLVIAGLCVLAGVVVLLLVGRARQAPVRPYVPPLPAGCSWVKPPPGECPGGDARAYQEWVGQNGPLTIRHDQSGIELIWVPGGSFAMGSEDGNRDEEPVHRVRLDGFWIGRTEVTVKQWRSVMDSVLGPDNDQGEDHPVVDVSWEQGQDFCQRTGLALPTEAQWEYAARGPEDRTYPWGDWWARSLCCSAESRRGHSRTVPVGSFPKGASWCGALDMAGNVYEWCRDWYDKDFYESTKRGATDPVCTRGDSGNRVLRGGSWFNHADSCRSAAREFNFSSLQDLDIGFRVARTR